MYIDSNVFINAYVNRGEEGDASMRLLKRIFTGEQNACTSPMAINETLYAISGLKGEEYALNTINRIVSMPNLEIYPIDKRVCLLLGDIVKEGLEPQDAFHAAVMKVNGIEVICSYDKHFDKIKWIRRQEPK